MVRAAEVICAFHLEGALFQPDLKVNKRESKEGGRGDRGEDGNKKKINRPRTGLLEITLILAFN